jgi:two-component sensor histidine kinase
MPYGVVVRILYIDDDPGLARLVQRNLTQKGYEVITCNTGDEGMRLLREQRFDIVALDHHMPDREGLDILAEIRSTPDNPPVIYVTGSEDSRVAVAALKSGAVDYVWKDIQGQFVELLGSAVEAAIAQERLRRAKEAAERDVREARDHAEVLLREVNHRVANSLQLVAALVFMQSSAISDPTAAEALRETQTRINAIAQIHKRLYTSDDVRFVEIEAYLDGLVDELRATMTATGRQHAIVLQADSIQVPTDKAVSIGVIVAELVTNAWKYAYPGETAGAIRICFRRDGDDNKVRLVVEDDGIGMRGVKSPVGTGIGTKIVNAMASNLRAAVELDPDHNGTRVRLGFAL